MVGRGALVAAFVALLLLPAASASGASRLPLALLPLPRAALGQAGHALPLAPDSGVDSNAHAASQATGNVTAARLKHLGRLSGYVLDYGTPFSDSPAVGEIQTEVEQYRTAAAARSGLGFWRKQELDVHALKALGIHVSFKRIALAHVPHAYWAYLATVKVGGLKPIYGVDAQMLEGAYLLDVSIGAGSQAAARRLVPVVAHKLDQRFRLAQEGRLHAKPVTFPRSKAGPPARGAKPDRIALTKADLGGPVTIRHAGYVSAKSAFDEYAISAYDLAMAPAGSFDELAQEISVGGSALEVKYFAAVAEGALAHSAGGGTATRVDLSGVGDNAFGQLVQISAGNRSASEAVVVLSRGKYLDFLVAAAASKLSASDVQSLAQKAAHRLDLAVSG